MDETDLTTWIETLTRKDLEACGLNWRSFRRLKGRMRQTGRINLRIKSVQKLLKYRGQVISQPP
jgi:hypothetical protein